ESLFHGHGGDFFLPLRPYRPHAAGIPERMLERAIGVVYKPETELQSHYFVADVVRQFDAVFHFDRTRAVEPLERSETWQRGEAPEAFPSGV
ncbi:MAG TPA: erythromycin esterase family protein, partial [Candidatus Acidoferrales bacterium]|nr:erythromycin esterase family protein [Candidatus Acidoferrales bacterium]